MGGGGLAVFAGGLFGAAEGSSSFLKKEPKNFSLLAAPFHARL
jgi:hypothetical protein